MLYSTHALSRATCRALQPLQHLRPLQPLQRYSALQFTALYTRPQAVASRPRHPLHNAANEEAALLAGGRLDDHVDASPVSHSGSIRRYERRTREQGGVARAARALHS